MRILFLITLLIFSTVLNAQEVFVVKEGVNRFSYFTRDADDPALFYLSGVKTPRTALRPTPFIKIAFDAESDPENIITAYPLSLRKSYPGFALYEAPSPQQVMNVASKIWEEPGVRFAIPVFVREKQLK